MGAAKQRKPVKIHQRYYVFDRWVKQFFFAAEEEDWNYVLWLYGDVKKAAADLGYPNIPRSAKWERGVSVEDAQGRLQRYLARKRREKREAAAGKPAAKRGSKSKTAKRTKR